MIKQKQLVPKRRFEGFSDEWEKRNFLDNIKYIIDFRGRTPRKLGLDWSERGYLALSALNVKNGYIDYNLDAHYGNQELYDRWMKGRELKKGQVLFTTEAPMGNVVQVPDERGYILSQRTIAFEQDPEKITNVFLASLLRSHNTFAKLSDLSSGGTAKGVSQKTLAELKVITPKNLREQQKIGQFFKHLDEMIALQQRKLDKTKSLKSAYLAEMFPAEGESVPKRRFSGFTEEWRSSKLENIINMHNNLRVPVTASKRITGDIPYYGANGIQDYVKGSTHDGEFVLIAEDGANDLTDYPVLYVNGEVWINNHAHVVTGKMNILDNLFLVSRMKSMDISKWLVGGGRAKLNAEVLKNIQIKIPDFKEQIKIGEFFKKIDGTILIHQQKLEKLKATKQAYLHEMFV